MSAPVPPKSRVNQAFDPKRYMDFKKARRVDLSIQYGISESVDGGTGRRIDLHKLDLIASASSKEPP